MSIDVPAEAQPTAVVQAPQTRDTHRATGPSASSLRTDRWPDIFATAFLLACAFILIITVVPPWARYFAREYDVLSMLTIPVTPG